MKKFLGAMLGVASALGLSAAAQAQITPNNIQQLIAAKGLSVVGNDQSNDGRIHVIAVADTSGWPYAFSLVDFDGNQTKDAVLMLTFVPNRQPSGDFINNINANAVSKAFIQQGNATMTFIQLAAGPVNQATLNAGFDVFRTEFGSYRQQIMQGPSGGNYFGVSLPRKDPYAMDAGMTRAEVTARDAALTAALNTVGKHVNAGAFMQVSLPETDEVDLNTLFSIANEAARRYQQ